VDGDYPAKRLAREPAPPYHGEEPFSLWHYSEDPDLGTFRPRPSTTGADEPPYVWAVDARHAPMFWFPRDCPRLCIWPVSTTSDDDRETFFGQAGTERVHVTESGWLDRLRACRIYAYRLPTEPFEPHGVGGYWVTEQVVAATERVPVGDLLTRHAEAGIELRITPSLWPIVDRIVASTVEFSGSRLRNAASRPDA
jgi:hypothetical protein